MRLFEETLRGAETDANGMRAAGRTWAARRLEAAEVERREILTDATYRASLVLREAEARLAAIQREALEHREQSMRHAMEDRDRLREEAIVEARQIREDAAEEVAKLMSTLNIERDHILADARDDARRIIEAAQEAVSIDVGPEAGAVASNPRDPRSPRNHDERFADLEDPFADETSDAAPEEPSRAVETAPESAHAPRNDDEWLASLEDLFPEETNLPPRVSSTREPEPRRRWFRRRR
jgi:hypothetical protein